MNDISKLTPSDILSIKQPEKLFSGETAVEAEYRILAKIWHPDRNKDPQANDVFAQVGTLYRAAKQKIEAGSWEIPGLYFFTDTTGKKFQVRYKRKHVFELGEMYVGEYTVTYFIDKSAQDLFDNAKKMMRSFTFANDKMKAEIQRYLPELHTVNETADRLVMVVKKDPEMILLRDLLDHLGGKIDPKHVAWMLSTIYNISCYLKYAKLTHNSIGPDTFFVSPKKHSGALIGGWWYSAPLGNKLSAAPARTITYAPRDLTTKKIADFRVDSELIRATGRELLGDGGGSKLLSDPLIPNALLNWLRTPGTGDAYREYEDWVKSVLKDSFGERRFVELKVQPSDVYKE
jgi:hypothetical protein